MDNTHANQFLSCRPKLYRFALSLTKDVNDAEDVFQETMLKLWELKAEWTEWQNFEAYAMSVLRNTFLNQVKKNKKQVYVALDEFEEQPVTNITDRGILLTDLKMQFYILISKLPAVQRDILHLREIEEMGYKEISLVLNITEAQVKVYLFRARQYLKSKTNGKR